MTVIVLQNLHGAIIQALCRELSDSRTDKIPVSLEVLRSSLAVKVYETVFVLPLMVLSALLIDQNRTVE